MPDHHHIYNQETEQYELLIAGEDYQHNIMKAIRRIVPNLGGIHALDIGAGTGRLSCLLAPLVQSLIATDASQAMLDRASENLERVGTTNWKTIVADNHSLPIAPHSIDLVTAGWTICYSTNDHVEQAKHNLALIMKQLESIV